MLELATGFLSRFSDELEQIRLKRSIGGKGRKLQHSTREDAISFTLRTEAEEFATNGLEMPDLLDQANFDYFSQWNGELRFVQNIKLKRVRKSDLQETMETL